MTDDSKIDLRQLPKAHLHVHLELAMRRDTLEELASRYGVKTPTRADAPDPWNYLIELYTACMGVLRTERDVERMLDEIVEDCALEGVVWIEPTLLVPAYRTLFGDDAAAVRSISELFQGACARHGVGGGLIIIADRTDTPEAAVEQASIAASFAGRGVVGFGLANHEVGYPGSPFRDAFGIAKDAGLLLAPHAGEMVGAYAVEEALDHLYAHRIAHGVTAATDDQVVKRLVQENICLDICPTSNLYLNIYPSWDQHPLPKLVAAGVKCSINADDPIVFGVSILDEYHNCRTHLGLSDAELSWIAKSSIEASAAPASQKSRWLALIDPHPSALEEP